MFFVHHQSGSRPLKRTVSSATHSGAAGCPEKASLEEDAAPAQSSVFRPEAAYGRCQHPL